MNFCAWRDRATCNGVTFQIAYVPNHALLPGCWRGGCNGYSRETGSSASSVAHELMEAITDPDLDGWYDQNGGEIGGKCSRVFDGCVSLSTDSFQIQSEWSNALNRCQQQ